MTSYILLAIAELHAARTMLASAPTPAHQIIARMVIAQCLATLAALSADRSDELPQVATDDSMAE